MQELDSEDPREEQNRELEEIFENNRKFEEEGSKNILKYFDRIHDKLFSYNNILIAGFFGLSKLVDSIPVITILIPISNLIFLIYLEYRMMEKSRFESNITNKKPDEIKMYGKSIKNTNFLSLLSMFTTFVVTIFFLRYLIFY
ncbi:hypothetical protein [Zobellia sp. B3R18]|uniref:hypothetical protein n=1 Tax=Zobellia sp. B3R18 TaxID=2841568 RepID=UPI001C07451C|nr:hypothetical protein [Zobellia sp. B3R18]MBU2973174.1 hypothetical protein [Zobellia sp. B3R18]